MGRGKSGDHRWHRWRKDGFIEGLYVLLSYRTNGLNTRRRSLLTFGGTLSVGGVSGRNANGAQVDHVQELEVVTGVGNVRRCSATRESDLFEAMLAGLGQCGVMTRAKVDLVPVKPMVRV